jgi:hypothetical protein
MQIVSASNDHIEIKIDNVSAIRYLLMPVLHTGDLQSVYFLDRESGDNWHYYSIVRTGKSASRLLAGNESSAIFELLLRTAILLASPISRSRRQLGTDYSETVFSLLPRCPTTQVVSSRTYAI